MPQETAKTELSDQRRAERFEVFLRTSMTLGRKSGVSAQLVNISTHGFMVRTSEVIEEQSRIRILLPVAGDVSAKVAWSLGGRIGCAFDLPFEEKDFSRVLGAIKTAKPNWQIS